MRTPRLLSLIVLLVFCPGLGCSEDDGSVGDNCSSILGRQTQMPSARLVEISGAEFCAFLTTDRDGCPESHPTKYDEIGNLRLCGASSDRVDRDVLIDEYDRICDSQATEDACESWPTCRFLDGTRHAVISDGMCLPGESVCAFLSNEIGDASACYKRENTDTGEIDVIGIDLNEAPKWMIVPGGDRDTDEACQCLASFRD